MKNAPKNISNSWREDPGTTRFFKNNAKFVDFRMKWVVMFCSESYIGETKCTEVKKNAHFPVIRMLLNE